MTGEEGFGPDSEMDEHGELLLDVLWTCAQWLVADPDPERFIARLADQGPWLFPALLTGAATVDAEDRQRSDAERAAQAARFFRTFGWAIASAMPLPTQDFKARKLTPPGRGDPCLCGSGRKFEHCCSGLMATMPPFESHLLGALVIDALPRKAWAELPRSQNARQTVLDAAELMADDERFADACKLLEPWAKLPAPWPDKLAELLDLLGEMYFELDKPRKRKQLAERMVAQGGPRVQSKGWQRLSMLANDAGDEEGSMSALQNAQRLTPDDPHVALIEVTSLIARGDGVHARARAAFHAKRLARLPDAASISDSIQTLEELADAKSGLSRRMREMRPDGEAGPGGPGAELHRWFESLPAPKLRLKLPARPCADLGELRPTGSADKALRHWRQVSPSFMSDADAAEIIFDGDLCLAALRSHAALPDSFDVLDDLLEVLAQGPLELTGAIRILLLQRAMDLWSLLRERQPAARCEWGYLGNRPALRLLARRVELDTTLTGETSFDWLAHLVEVLNPNDNFGFRERLAAVRLRRGDSSGALRLCERYPDDFVGMNLLHARALLAEQRIRDAGVVFHQALKQNIHVGPLLLASRAPSMPDVASYGVGSKDEAAIAVSAQFDLWRSDPAVRKWVLQSVEAQSNDGGRTPGLFDET